MEDQLLSQLFKKYKYNAKFVFSSPLKFILMRTLFNSILLTTLLSFIVSCKSDTELANEVLNTAIQMDKVQNNQPKQDSGKLSIQNSDYTTPVKKAPTQEELIKKYKVKTVKEIGDSGWLLTTYDKKGNKLMEESDYLVKKTFSYEFDKNNQIIQEKTKHKDGITFIKKYEYDKMGKLISKSFTNDDDGKTSFTKFEYNTDLNTCMESSSSGIDKEFYDNRGLRVRFESYDESKKLVGSGEAKYDEDGLKISETSSVMGMDVVDKFEYNENGQLLKLNRTGILGVYFLYEYNEKGLISNTNTIKNQTEDKVIYKYTFY